MTNCRRERQGQSRWPRAYDLGAVFRHGVFHDAVGQCDGVGHGRVMLLSMPSVQGTIRGRYLSLIVYNKTVRNPYFIGITCISVADG
jgi:hypothetical protein